MFLEISSLHKPPLLPRPFLPRIVHANPRGRDNLPHLLPSVFKPKSTLRRGGFSIKGLINLQSLGHASGAGVAFDSADEDGGGEIFGARNDAPEPVDAVVEIDVKVAGACLHVGAGAW